MMWKQVFAAAAVVFITGAAALPGVATAQENRLVASAPKCVAGNPKAPRFIVSGIMQAIQPSADGSRSIRLVHGIETAVNADAAVGAFVRRVAGKYPEYAMMDTVVDAVPVVCSYTDI